MLELSAMEVKKISNRVFHKDIARAAHAGTGVALDRKQAKEVCSLLEIQWVWDKVGDCYYRLKWELGQ